MKILVFLSDNRLLSTDIHSAEYNSLVAAINYQYCKKHGYDYIYYRPYLNKNDIILNNCLDPNSGVPRHASWSKLLSTMNALELNYDYVVYIDTDCIFKDFNKSLEDFIQPYSQDIIFLNNKPWGGHLPCAGFYVCKVNDYTRKFIKCWYNYSIPEKNTEHAWEQDALWKIFKQYNVAIVYSEMMFRNESGQFLRHVASHEKYNRLPYFKKFIQDNNIDYLTNIQQIQVISFDTNT